MYTFFLFVWYHKSMREKIVNEDIKQITNIMNEIKYGFLDREGNNSVEIPLARVNYTLRAAVIPAGAHQLRMVFEPHALKTDKASMAILILALLLSAGALTSPLWRKKN